MNGRGQTTLDFAIGISLFLAIVLFIFLFVPGILEPFTASAQVETVSTDRVADQLGKQMLGSPRHPYVIDGYCTVQFFANATAPDCPFDDRTALARQFGFEPDRQGINVSVRGNASSTARTDELLCWDVNDETLVSAGASECDTVLARGDAPPTSNDASVTALRVAYLAGEDVTIYVEMW